MKLRKRFARFDAVLDTDRCSARNNADLTLTLRMGFRQINPTGTAAMGTYNDYGSPSGTPRKIVKWTAAEWTAWKTNFCRSAQAFWDGKFWIDNRRGALAVTSGAAIVIPNAFCRFELIGSEAATGFHHHVIDVVRLDASEAWFGSHSQLYDSKDTNSVEKARDSKNQPIMQRAHVHEVGHLLGLGHVAIGQPKCPATGDTNAAACYGVTDTDKNSVMGAGMRLDSVHAQPWLTTFEALIAAQPRSAVYTPPPAKVRPAVAVMQRIYPRTVAEFEAGAVLTKLPKGR